MCGVCGLVSVSAEIDPNVLLSMNASLVHRGPDSAGTFIDRGVGLAARRLAIIDLQHGTQPIANEDGSVHVVQNGEIYNYRELRAELERRGHRFATRSDTEVLVHLYEEAGTGFFERLRGMFAIALWDRRERRLVLARDRFGIKPLYYRIADGGLSFSSELKALLRVPGFSRELDLDALESYLATNAVPAPYTIFREARKLPAGHVLVWQRRIGAPEVTIEPYARIRPVPAGDVRHESERELAEELRHRLRDSVRAHLVADVPVGVLLSGGIDSSALTALAAEASSGPVQTFSIGFEERSFDELDRARLVAARYATDHHELVLRPDAVELLPTLVEAFDEPFADSSALPTLLVSALARQHVKVALSGEGGDELFGGYYTYVADLLAPRARAAARLVRPLVERLPSSSRKVSFDYKAKRFVRSAALPALERHLAWKEIFSSDLRAELLSSRDRGADPVGLYRARYDETEGCTALSRLQDVDLGIYLPDDLLVKVDRASMAHSLEARVPFLDPVVAEFALALPDHLKVRGFSKKRLLRRALAPLVPPAILHGRKHGFSLPIAAWLRGELEGFTRDVLSPAAVARQGIFRPEAVTRLVDIHVSRREDLSRQLWNLLCFTLWFERYGSGSAAAGDAALPVAARAVHG